MNTIHGWTNIVYYAAVLSVKTLITIYSSSSPLNYSLVRCVSCSNKQKVRLFSAFTAVIGIHVHVYNAVVQMKVHRESEMRGKYIIKCKLIYFH